MRVALAVLVAVVLCALAPAAWASPGWARLTVQPGDSLSVIARRYGISFEELARLNGLDWRKPLLAGAVLRVPVAHADGLGWSGLYVVQPGDTLSGIAVHYRVSLAQLVSENGIDPAKPLWVGVRLRVPAAGSLMPDLTAIVERDAYQRGALGYDVSYPNCALGISDSASFAVVGLNGGRPFTSNPCFDSEWLAASGPRSVYINSAYSPTMFDQITPGCAAAGSSQPLRPASRRAFALGCDEAAAALQRLDGLSPAPAAIWVDVERANTWSPRRALNIATLKGMLDELLLRRPGSLVGVYSTVDSWHRIVGNWDRLSVPEWIGTALGAPSCPSGFSGGPVWLSQSIDGALDVDTAC